MLHPSYTDLMAVVNSEVEPGEHPVVQSRYSIVLATAKRAREIIAGQEPLVNTASNKPLSIAVDELYSGKVKIVGDDEEEIERKVKEAEMNAEADKKRGCCIFAQPFSFLKRRAAYESKRIIKGTAVFGYLRR